MKHRKLFGSMTVMIIVCGLLLAAGCDSSSGPDENQAGADRPVVAVTIVPEKTFVEAVCGDLASVVVMVPPGNSPANYEPAPREMEQFSRAEVYFTIGVPAEEASILPEARDFDDMNIVRLQDEVARAYPDIEIAPGQRDPHIWLSPRRAIVMVEVIAGEMAQIDPPNKEIYFANSRAYIAELEALDGELQKALEGVKDKKFIVFHPAFGYLASDYGLQMLALEEEGKEATPQRLQEMIDLAKREHIRVIFYQEEISSSQAQAFAEEIGGKTVQVAPLAPDYIDNMRRMADLMASEMQ